MECRLSVEFVSVKPERMAAYRQALRILAGLFHELLEQGERSSGRERLRSWHWVGIGRVDAHVASDYSTVVSI